MEVDLEVMVIAHPAGVETSILGVEAALVEAIRQELADAVVQV